MYFKLAKNSKLSMTASTDSVVYATVIYEDSVNPSTGFIETDTTTYAVAYQEPLSVNSITLKNTSETDVSSICIYIDYELMIPCFSLAAGKTLTLNDIGQNYQMVSTSSSGGATFSLQHETDGAATITVLAATTLLWVDPTTAIAGLDIEMPSSPTSGWVLGVLFGTTIDARGTVATGLTFSGGTFYQGSTLTTAKGGDYIEYQYVSSQWKRIK